LAYTTRLGYCPTCDIFSTCWFIERDILCVYCSIICSVLEYACPIWHSGLTKKLSKDIERVQTRCLKLMYPSVSYSRRDRIDYRRDVITQKVFREIIDPKHRVHDTLSPAYVSHSQMTLRVASYLPVSSTIL